MGSFRCSTQLSSEQRFTGYSSDWHAKYTQKGKGGRKAALFLEIGVTFSYIISITIVDVGFKLDHIVSYQPYISIF